MKKQKQLPYEPLSAVQEATFGNVRPKAGENGEIIEAAFLQSFDIVVKSADCGGRKVVFANCDGLCNTLSMTESAVKPMLSFAGKLPEWGALDFIGEKLISNTQQKKEPSLDEALGQLLKGCLLIFVDGESECLSIGVQKLPERSINEPQTEVEERGSREGFVENIKTNLMLVRKRLCTVNLRAESLEVGKTGKTRVCLCYLKGRVDEIALAEVRKRIDTLPVDFAVGEGSLQKVLDTRRRSMFSMVTLTERPDTFCAKLCEGKIGLLVDGTPFSLVVPRLFVENFQTLDDYLNRPYYATFMRIMRIMSFVISVVLPGTFVAVGVFHQELLPDDMLYNIVLMESNTMFNLMTEALIIHFIYEIVREAGLRMPKTVGHAISIVGALVIGDAAVTAGLIGAPMLIVVALTAVSSLVVSDLYQPISVLRLLFILIGGMTGLYGIMIGLSVIVMNLAAMTDYGIPYLAPLAPINASILEDTVVRRAKIPFSEKLFRIGKLNIRGKSR